MSSVPVDYYDLAGLLTPAEREVQGCVREFCDAEVTPVINGYWDRGEFPFELLPKLAQLGITGGSIHGYGCPGMSAVAAGLVSAELSRGDGSLSTFFTVHSSVAMTTIAMLGSEEQKQRWLPPMARLEKIGAFALTEPDHGSDIVAMETRAHREGDFYVLNGAKRWIGNASFSDVLIVWARDDEGNVGAFVASHDTPGVDVRVITGKTSKRAVWQTDIQFTDARVPVANRLEGSRSFKDTSRVLNATRCGVAWEALGHAMAAYEIALAYVQQRHQFGQPLAAFQIIQQKLALMLAKVTSMQLLSWRVSSLLGEGKLTPGMASLAKMNNARLAREVVAEGRDLLGGNGTLLEYHMGRHHADLESVFSYEGSDTIQSLIVGREITGISAFK